MFETDFKESKRLKELGFDFSKFSKSYFDKKGTEHVKLKNPDLIDVAFSIHVDGDEGEYTTDFIEEYPIASYYVLQKCLPPKFEITDDLLNPYEAFIWCHENYPEELRNRFNEIVNNK